MDEQSGDHEEGLLTTSTALATGKLGKLSVRTDVRTLRLRTYVDPAAYRRRLIGSM